MCGQPLPRTHRRGGDVRGREHRRRPLAGLGFRRRPAVAQREAQPRLVVGGENWEVLIKVLDGCSLNGHVWVFGASTTNLGYLIHVTDTVTGTFKEYRNEPGRPAPAITDPTVFPGGCGR